MSMNDEVNPELTDSDTVPPQTDAADRAEQQPDAAQSDPQDRNKQVGGAEAYVVALQADLDDARREIEDLKRQLLYSQAEFQNFRRRKEEEQKDLARFANGELIRNLLPILDNFERALQASEQSRNFDALVGGVSGTHKQFSAFLEKSGVRPIEALGKEFDPNFHEAIGHTESDDYPANTVGEEVQRGYLLHDRVLRPALVKVVQG